MRMAGETLAEYAERESGPGGWWDRNAAMPGNYFVLPDQMAEHRSPSGSYDNQYPQFRADLVRAGLLPSTPPDDSLGRTVKIPAGMTIREAIARGLLK